MNQKLTKDKIFKMRVDSKFIAEMDRVARQHHKPKAKLIRDLIQTAPSHTELLTKQKGK